MSTAEHLPGAGASEEAADEERLRKKMEQYSCDPTMQRRLAWVKEGLADNSLAPRFPN
ncbi:MAG: hypothetical protein M3198_15505 [Actinomycetota bacterium]|nr:hypothetical protein [Actinomycetota bacterium]